ncbi:hypothetical protein B0H12DRAFT_341760 [Mycena haematopus]|nr:hypothetical protein B0H12DRAFT_341760 [Mycena haematopus]
MATMDVARSLSLQPAATQDTLRQKAASPEPHYRLSRLNPPASLHPPSLISRSVSAGMTFSFKKDKEKDKEKDSRRQQTAPSPEERPPAALRLLSGQSSLASLLSSPSPQESASVSRTSSTSSVQVPTIVQPTEDVPVPGPSEEYDSDDSDADEDVHAPDRFVKKNAWRTRHKMRVHPYPDVPYMQAYDPVVLENERYTHYLLRRLAPIGSPTFHNYHNSPPASVLDLGCGTGLWLLDSARIWRTTQFVGLDLVDVALPAFSDGVTPNVRLVRGDFLKYALPFPDRPVRACPHGEPLTVHTVSEMGVRVAGRSACAGAGRAARTRGRPDVLPVRATRRSRRRVKGKRQMKPTKTQTKICYPRRQRCTPHLRLLQSKTRCHPARPPHPHQTRPCSSTRLTMRTSPTMTSHRRAATRKSYSHQHPTRPPNTRLSPTPPPR